MNIFKKKEEKPALREDTKYESVQGTGASVEQFNFPRAAPGMADLMRRLYQIRVDCGAIQVDKSDAEQQAEQLKNMRKLDAFERSKVEMNELLEETRGFLEERAKGEDDALLRKNLIKNMTAIEKLYKEMERLQHEAVNRKGIWAQLGKTKMTPEMQQQRDDDLSLIHKHIQQVKKEHKRLLMGKSKSSSSDDNKKKKKNKKIEFDSVENMKDMSKDDDKNLPKIDISAGLAQLKEMKDKEDQYLDILLNQVGTMGDLAQSYKDELELQCTLLDKLETDVNKHLETMGTVNKNMDKLIEAAGGNLKLTIIGILIIVVIAIVGIGFIFLKQFLLK